MPYQALYRQWRPRKFSNVVGQEAIMETLRHQVETGRIPHAYLFCGSRGTGKTSTAKILASAINCEHPVNGDPCGECETCRLLSGDENLDIVEMDAASNRGIDDARVLRESVKYPPQSGKYKVYIIDEVHMLTTEAFNALLKTLEEPPSFIVFILATTEPHKLPATILSRCQRFDFSRIPVRQIAGRLREAANGAGAEASDGALMAIAKAAEGGMRDALSILDMCIGYGKKIDETLVQNVLGTSDRAFLFRFSEALQEENAAEVIRLIDILMRSGREPAAFARSFCDHLRTLLMAKCCGAEITEVLDLTEETAEEYLRQAEKISSSRLMEMLDLFVTLDTDMKSISSPRVALEKTSLKCCLRTTPVDTLSLNDRIAELENQINLLQDQIKKGVQLQTENNENKKETDASGKVKKEAGQGKATAKKKPVPSNEKEVWDQALKQMLKTDPMIRSYLFNGELISANDAKYCWKSMPSLKDVVPRLNAPEMKTRIETCLSDIAGSPCTFVAVDGSLQTREKKEDSDEAYEEDLAEIFGLDAVQVIDEIPSET